MLFKKIDKLNPDQVFLIVRNNGTTSMSSGHGVVFDYRTNSVVTNEGVGVVFPEDYWAEGVNPVLFAGIVSGKPIPSHRYGSIQVWGHTDTVFVSFPTNAGPAYAGVSLAIFNDSSLASNLYLRPLGLTVTNNCTGLLGIYVQDANLPGEDFSPTPGVIPLDALKVYSSTTYGTLSYTSSGCTKGFIRCL